MLHFYRKMRKALIPESRFGRYFFYALGEIVLVVIGILIALQLNSWNADRINKKTEHEYILRLAIEIKSEIQYLEVLKNEFKKSQEGLERILTIWKSDTPLINDSLQYINDFYSAGDIDPWYNEPVTWTQLVQTGDLKLISDQKLIDELFTYYANLKKSAVNYEGFPYDIRKEARLNWTKPFINKSVTRPVPVDFYHIAPKEVFDYIWINRADYQNLYTAIAYSSVVNYQLTENNIKMAKDVLKSLEMFLDKNK